MAILRSTERMNMSNPRQMGGGTDATYSTSGIPLPKHQPGVRLDRLLFLMGGYPSPGKVCCPCRETYQLKVHH